MNTAPTTTRDNVRHLHAAALVDGIERRREAVVPRAYRAGWRWGFANGLLCGCVLICMAMAIGSWIGTR